MADDDPSYLKFVREQPCVSCGKDAPSQAHHHTRHRGMGQRAPDKDAMPLCFMCHRRFHDASERFAEMTRRERELLQDGWVWATQKVWEQLHNEEMF